MKKSIFYFFLLTLTLLIGCNNGVTVKGRIIDVLANKPLINRTLSIEGIGNIKTDNDGCFEIRHLLIFREYIFDIQTAGFTPVSVHTTTKDKKQLIDIGQLVVIPQPPEPGIFTYSQGKYSRLSVNQAFRFYLNYGEPGKVPIYIPTTEDGRLAAWLLKNESISSIIKIPQDIPFIVWQSAGFNEIAPLFQHKGRTITYTLRGPIMQANIPGGWYLGLKDIIIDEKADQWYASLNYKIIRWPFNKLNRTDGQNFSVISTTFEPGKYAFCNSEMDWNPNSDYATVNGVHQEITSSVPVFEIIKK